MRFETLGSQFMFVIEISNAESSRLGGTRRVHDVSIENQSHRHLGFPRIKQRLCWQINHLEQDAYDSSRALAFSFRRIVPALGKHYDAQLAACLKLCSCCARATLRVNIEASYWNPR
jgi:hypothetical protein